MEIEHCDTCRELFSLSSGCRMRGTPHEHLDGSMAMSHSYNRLLFWPVVVKHR